MRTTIATLVCTGFLAASLHAGGGVSIKEMLLASFSDEGVKQLEQNVRINMKGAYGGIPLINDLELRLRNEAFDINRLRYTLRLQPSGIGETWAANRYNKLFTRNYDKKLQLGKNKALRNRYQEILDQMEYREVENHYKELIVVYEDMIAVMEKKKFAVEGFDLNDLIDNEDQNTKLHNQLFEFKRQYFSSQHNISSSLHKQEIGEIDTAGFVEVDSVIALIERNGYAFDTNNVYLEYFRLQEQLARARYELEKAENRQYVSFLGFSYDNGDMLDEIVRRDDNKTYNFNNSYAVEFGFKIPDLTMARQDLARRRADYLKEQEDYEEVKLELIDQMKKDKADLLSFIAQYRFLKNRENEVDATSSLKKYLQMSGVDPLVLLSIKESILKNHVELSKLKYRILRNYVQVLDVAGELSKRPLRNFLSKNQEVIEP